MKHNWKHIEGWYDYHDGAIEAVRHFPDGSRFLELGTYLGLSLCAIADLIQDSGKRIQLVGVDHCRGTGVENGNDNHQAAVERGRGNFAGELYRNVIDGGYSDVVSLLVTDSATAASLFPDNWFDWVNIDAAHDEPSVKRDIELWVGKVKPQGWLTGDDYCPEIWKGVVKAVRETLPGHTKWAHDSWRYIKP